MTKETMQPNQTLHRLINASHTHTRSVWIQINIINRHMPGGGAVFVQRSTFFLFFFPPNKELFDISLFQELKYTGFYPADLSFAAREQWKLFNRTQLFTAGACLKKATLLHLFPYFVLSWLKQSEFSHYHCVQHCFSTESQRVFTDRGTKVHAVTNWGFTLL